MTETVVAPDPLNPKAKDRKGRRHPVTTDVQGDTRIRRPVGYKRRIREVAQRVEIHERRRQAYQLALGAFDHISIGLYLHADPSVNSRGIAVVSGYGWRNYAEGKPPLQHEALRVTVSRDITAGLEQAAKYEKLSREQYVLREVGALDAAQAALWGQVLKGSGTAIERFVKLSERRSKLLGLDAPVQTEQKIEQTVTVQGALPEINLEFANEVFDALALMGAVTELPSERHEALAALDSGDIVDAEVVPRDTA